MSENNPNESEFEATDELLNDDVPSNLPVDESTESPDVQDPVSKKVPLARRRLEWRLPPGLKEKPDEVLGRLRPR